LNRGRTNVKAPRHQPRAGTFETAIIQIETQAIQLQTGHSPLLSGWLESTARNQTPVIHHHALSDKLPIEMKLLSSNSMLFSNSLA
jgi:hypothetical protein